MPRLLPPLILVAALCAPSARRHAAGAAEPFTFEAHVRPILKAHCWQCHGEEEERKGNLDTRLAQFLLKGGDSGPAIVAGKHDESLLYERVAAGEMPPGKKKLSPREIETIAQWIDTGAKTARPEPESLAAGDTFTEEERSHWSFQAIRRPVVPRLDPPPAIAAAGTAPLPDGRGSSLVRSPIDAFVFARLQARGLAFAPEADRVTLIRRLSFDLTGLPAAPEEVDGFVGRRRAGRL